MDDIHDSTYVKLWLEGKEKNPVEYPKSWEFRPERRFSLHSCDEPSPQEQIEIATSDREQCRRVVAIFRTKLPRELRDEVYRHLVTDHNRWGSCWGVGLKGLSEASDKHFVKSDMKIFCPSYVGHQVAREAAECYHANNTFKLLDFGWGFRGQGLGPGVLRQLNTDNFELDVMPHKFIRRLSIDLTVDDICPQITMLASGETYWMNPDENLQEEKHSLDLLYESLESAFSPLANKAKLNVEFMIRIKQFEKYDRIIEHYKSLNLGKMKPKDHFKLLDIERAILNVLEAIRQPVYELKSVGASFTFIWETHWTRENRPIKGLFHLTREEWEKEKEEHMRQFTRYEPYRYYIEPSKLLSFFQHWEDKAFVTEFLERRRRWGYESFEEFLGTNAGQSQGGQSRGGQSRGGQSRGGQSRGGQGRG